MERKNDPHAEGETKNRKDCMFIKFYTSMYDKPFVLF